MKVKKLLKFYFNAERAERLIDNLICKKATSVSFARPADDCAEEVAELARSLGVPANRFPCGSVLQNGSLIFAAEGKLPVHNPLELEFTWKGRHIRFTGYDSLWISADMEQAIYPEGELTIDGKKIPSCEAIQ